MSLTKMSVFLIMLAAAVIVLGLFFGTLLEKSPEGDHNRLTFKSIAISLFVLGFVLVGFSVQSIMTGSSEVVATSASGSTVLLPTSTATAVSVIKTN